MRKTAVLIMLSAFVLCCWCMSDAYAADYTVDTQRSELVVQIFKSGIASAIAHNHVIRAVEFSGDAKIDRDDPETSSIRVDAQTASFEVDEPEMRKKYGLAKTVSDRDRQKIRATMISPAQLDIEEYPTMSFVSTRIGAQSDGHYLITGDLTIHGVTKSISFPVIAQEGNESLSGSVSIDFKQSDFGIEPYSAMLGALRNKDDAILHAKIVLLPSSESEPGPD